MHVKETGHDFTLGYFANIHQTKNAPVNWHSEAVSLSPRNETELCIYKVVTVASNVSIIGNQIKVESSSHYAVKLDKVISFEIVKENSCHYGYLVKVLDSKSLD